jgi:hypothetical protein
VCTLQQTLDLSPCLISFIGGSFRRRVQGRRGGAQTWRKHDQASQCGRVVARQALALPSRRTGERKCLDLGCKYFPELSLFDIKQNLSALFVVFARTSF